MKIIACLGNPGTQYTQTRHNAGFILGHTVVSGWNDPTVKHQAIVYDGRLAGQKVLVVFPQTYMNLSGRAIRGIAAFYKIPPSDCLVLYDDFDLPLGVLRFRAKGSAGTHNGMKSMVTELGTTEFPRLRIGIGPKATDRSVSDFVLSAFSQSELLTIQRLAQPTLEILSLWVAGDIDGATRRAASEQAVQQ